MRSGPSFRRLGIQKLRTHWTPAFRRCDGSPRVLARVLNPRYSLDRGRTDRCPEKIVALIGAICVMIRYGA